MGFKENIKKLRMEKGWSQRKLASELNVTQAAIYNWEKGERQPSKEMFERIAEKLGTTPAQLIGWDNSSQKEFITDTQAFPYESLDLKYVPDEVMRDLLAVQYETTEDTITENDIEEAKKRAARDPIFLKELFKGRLGTAAAIEMTNREIRAREQFFAEDRENREKIRNEMDIADYIILEFFHLLNDNGKDKLVDYAADLVKIEEYLEKKEE